ncbi:MAG: bifunctional hydroxymethylpyrimidine kinase/phosphomethylpyrimidine kinase [Pseudomonadota bacterium]
MKQYHRALTIAGSDSGGGAGIQADLKTFSALGCFGMSVITALTAQNTLAVTAIHSLPAAFIAAQLDAVLGDIGVDAVKIGMLHSPEVIAAVVQGLRRHGVGNIVVDPVMVAKSGDTLLRKDAVDALRDVLLPMADLITPNLPEASVLLDRPVVGIDDMEPAARDLAALGCGAVLIKGGHLNDSESIDILYLADSGLVLPLTALRVDTLNTHGTGCTLSSAVAAGLARGRSMEDAVREAKSFVTGAIRAAADYQIGGGHGPVHHFHAFWR